MQCAHCDTGTTTITTTTKIIIKTAMQPVLHFLRSLAGIRQSKYILRCGSILQHMLDAMHNDSCLATAGSRLHPDCSVRRPFGALPCYRGLTAHHCSSVNDWNPPDGGLCEERILRKGLDGFDRLLSNKPKPVGISTKRMKAKQMSLVAFMTKCTPGGDLRFNL